MKSAKECVTTHLPNGLAPKMDGAAVAVRYQTADDEIVSSACRRANALCRSHNVGCGEALGVSLGETVPSADLGGSSMYSNENFED